MEIHTAETLLSDPSLFDVETATAKLKRHKSRGSDYILAELIQTGHGTLWSEIHILINTVCIKEELPDQWKECIIIAVYKMGNKLTMVLTRLPSSSFS
jgi:hypothetical protein